MAAPGPPTIHSATFIRQRVIMGFERAEVATDPEETRRLLSFVVVGGGPTGVEMAGAIAELARHALARDFSRINPKDARVVLVEAGPRLLAGFDERLSARAAEALAWLGVVPFFEESLGSAWSRTLPKWSTPPAPAPGRSCARGCSSPSSR